MTPVELTSPIDVGSFTAAYYANEYHAGTGEFLELFDPSTGEMLLSMRGGSVADVDAAVTAAAQCYASTWSTWPALERSRLCHRIGELLLADLDRLTDLVVHDAGLPTSMARRDIQAAARYFEYYAGVGQTLHGATIPVGEDFFNYTVREPWGVCGVIVPFNVPMQMAARSLAPALVTGNTVVIKAAEQAPLAPLALAAICARAGCPPGAVSVIAGNGSDTGHALVAHPLVEHVTFTGSRGAGAQVMTTAAAGIKPVILELGGKSPHLVFADADFDRAVTAIVASGLRTAGQVCSAGTRVLVERSAFDEIAGRLATTASSLRVGVAADDPDVGPVVSTQQRAAILDGIDRGLASGGKAVAGEHGDAIYRSTGYFVAPTVIEAESLSCTAMHEEIFGPVLSVYAFADDREAIEIANDSEYGLVAGVWTGELARAHKVAGALKAGQVFLNCYGVGAGVEQPFGGYKRSGFGRLKGVAGALEYTQLKNICAAIS
jgi:aldehyde dehydrogenase (NAD+)